MSDGSSRAADPAMTVCDFCGRPVPVLNLQIHQAHACSATRQVIDMYSSRNIDSSTDAFSTLDATVSLDDSAEIEFWTVAAHGNGSSNETHAVSEEDEDQDSKFPARAHGSIIDLYDINDYDIDDDVGVVHQAKAATLAPSQPSDQWTCPTCTLENAQWQLRCDACASERPGNLRDPDPVIRERPIAELPRANEIVSQFGWSSPTLDPLLDSIAMERAILNASPEALPGDLFEEMLGRYLSPSSEENVPSAALASPPRRRRGNSRNSTRLRPVASAATANSPSSPPRRRRRQSHDGVDDIMTVMMEQALATLQLEHRPHRFASQPDVDGMSYEQLLAAFGDGSDEMGGSEADIGNLPVVKLNDPNTQLPPDCRQCNICLEDFEQGDQRKTLPCLHGFHAQCADTWLRSKGMCPVCKNKISCM
jgi:Ring finger domain/Zn-finger in Ran binding protein and others